MLDIKLIRERPDFVKGELAKRGIDPAEVDRLLEVDQKRRAREVGKLPADQRAAEIAKIRADEADEEKLDKILTDIAAANLTENINNPWLNLGAQLGLAERNVE